ncbi:hypothetical protein [Paraburkholderia sp. BL10I2N1]|uniref:hypothetical protein n=1 Tax=Paraburkholderia sp. BL10I2N1 TaxID=1938796 RepID=UPI00105FA3B5|nr:hypothetical protein [Paraburkholderia sp. BL10I2N1]TDN59084.1 hypothetical protein B0G77_8273 [Paraburkholderia sp. BL10I2N1]
MSNKKDTKKTSNSDDSFNPTRREDDEVPGNALEPQTDLPPTFAHIPSGQELSAAARESFAGDLPDSLIRTIIQESEEVAHSTRKILQEHMRIGGNFAHILTSVQNHMIGTLGDKPAVRTRASELVYNYLTKVFRRSKSSVRLYIRCYLKFSNNSGAVQMLSHSDMALLVGNDLGDDVIDMVIDAKTNDPDLSKRDIKKLISEYRDQLTEKDTRIEAVMNELTNVSNNLDEVQLENRRLVEERERLQKDLTRDRENAQSTAVELSSVSKQISVLQQELANRERELDQATRELVSAASKVQTEKVPVPTVPEQYRNLEEAVEAVLSKLKEASAQLEQKQAELAALEQKLDTENAAIEANEVLEKKASGLIQLFGSFVQEYHSTQLMVTADGFPARFVSLFQALADLVGKFHGELLAVTRAA